MTTNQQKQAALQLRYGDKAAPAAGVVWNETLNGLLSHRSVRRFSKKPLEAGTLETLVAAAQSASTSSNLQCWSVINVTDPAMRQELVGITNGQKHVAESQLFLVWLCDLSRNRRLGDAHGHDLTALELTESFMVGVIDAALAAQNAVVAAESMGLSCVYIGALRNNSERVSEMLKLPSGVVGVFGMCIGYAEQDAEVKPRLPQEAVLFENHYQIHDEARIRQEYDQTLGEFSRRHEMANDTWTERVIERTLRKTAIGGRAYLRATLEKLGFPLK